MNQFYRINLSHNGQHLFRAENEQWTRTQMIAVVQDMRKRFPVSDGYKVDVTIWQCQGIDIEVA